MSPNILFLTGAPLPSSLDWHHDKLHNGFIPVFAQFTELSQTVDDLPSVSMPSLLGASWRFLRPELEHLQTGHSQAHTRGEQYHGEGAYSDNSPNASQSLSSSSNPSEPRHAVGQISGRQLMDGSLSQYYEHSLALHEDFPSSQIPLPPAEGGGETVMSGLEDGDTSQSNLSFSSPLEPSETSRSQTSLPTTGHVIGLDRLPNVAYLQSIQPQTITINVIVGIISISPSRVIKTRHGSTIDIVEVLVGDETKSGFSINFWVASLTAKAQEPRSLRETLVGLRPQDIILVRNMALSSYRGRVYGQSLRRDMTKVDLLYRKRIDRADVGGYFSTKNLNALADVNSQSQAGKTRRVKDWVLNFVSSGLRSAEIADGTKLLTVQEMMPPDTQ